MKLIVAALFCRLALISLFDFRAERIRWNTGQVTVEQKWSSMAFRATQLHPSIIEAKRTILQLIQLGPATDCPTTNKTFLFAHCLMTILHLGVVSISARAMQIISEKATSDSLQSINDLDH